MKQLTSKSICNRCGWSIDESVDCYCSGCGRCLRQLQTVGDEKVRTLYFPSGEGHAFPIKNIGDHELSIKKQWEFIGLEGLSAIIGGSSAEPVSFMPGETKTIEIHFNGDALTQDNTGKLRIDTGSINPPLAITLVCSQMPQFYFRLNGQLVRDNHVRVISPTPEIPDLEFEIELQGAAMAHWKGFKLYPDVQDSHLIPLPDQVALPYTITGEKEVVFQINPDLRDVLIETSITLSAEFYFEHCPPRRISIEIIKAGLITHRQDIYHIDENAIVEGSTTNREISIEIKNSGGVGIEIRSIRSLCPSWLERLNLPENYRLEPDDKYSAQFSIWIDPCKLPADVLSIDGKIQVSYVELGTTAILETILHIPIEIRKRPALRHAMAIDFGNTSTCVAHFDDNNQLQVVPLDGSFPGVFEFPTIIEFLRFQKDDSLEVGEGFRYGVLLEKNRYARENNYLHRMWAFKLGIGFGPEKRVTRIDIEKKAARTFTYDELIRFYFMEVYNRFEENSGYKARDVIITYPANFSKKQISQLVAVASDAMPGVRVTAEISEPEALAINYFYDRPIQERKDFSFAVFDFGGGTTDISIGRIHTADGYQTVTILVSMGLEQLGGDALTFELARNIYNMACTSFDRPDPLFPKHYEDIFSISGAESHKLGNFMNLMKVAEDLKTNENNQLETLLEDGQLSIGIKSFYAHRQGNPEFSVVEYRKEDLDRIAKGHIAKGVEKLSAIFEHLEDHNILESNKPDFVILGGNSSRLPLVKKTIMASLSLDESAVLFDPKDAKIAVAKGAAYYGRLRKNPDSALIFDNAPRLKFPLGIVDWQDRFEVIFPAGSLIRDGKLVRRTFKLITPGTELALYWNKDPSDMTFHGGGNIQLAAIHSLARYSTAQPEPVTFSLCLTDKGIQLRRDNGTNERNSGDRDKPSFEPDIIPIDF